MHDFQEYFFQDFPGREIFKKKIQNFSGFSRRCGSWSLQMETGADNGEIDSNSYNKHFDMHVITTLQNLTNKKTSKTAVMSVNVNTTMSQLKLRDNSVQLLHLMAITQTLSELVVLLNIGCQLSFKMQQIKKPAKQW